jgi:hypothetical protein
MGEAGGQGAVVGCGVLGGGGERNSLRELCKKRMGLHW